MEVLTLLLQDQQVQVELAAVEVVVQLLVMLLLEELTLVAVEVVVPLQTLLVAHLQIKELMVDQESL